MIYLFDLKTSGITEDTGDPLFPQECVASTSLLTSISTSEHTTHPHSN